MSETGDVIRRFHHGWPKLNTLGELVDLARATPETKIFDTVFKHTREAERLCKMGARMSVLRQLIVAGVLINRAVFEIYRVPLEREHQIEPPDEARP
jgi:hypothetical protein